MSTDAAQDIWLELHEDGSVTVHHPDGWRVADEEDAWTLLRPLVSAHT